MVVRYMGTKRHMADPVRETIISLTGKSRAVDLFSGMGSVAESLCDGISVVTNDALSFSACISRARFTALERSANSVSTAARLKPAYESRLRELELKYADQLAIENYVLSKDENALGNYMTQAQHVGNSIKHRQAARHAAEASGSQHYELATLYFSAGYLSLRQAMELDAIRAAIDSDDCPTDRDWLLGAWLSATSAVINAPGHTAQFLKPNSGPSHARIVRFWKRSIWDEFGNALLRVNLVGSRSWRSGNAALLGDALDLVRSGQLHNAGVIYADPPYTRDQYSRYYHVYETLYKYDFPDSSGAGRNRSDRFTTGFCLKGKVVASFHELCRSVARMRVPLVISYPADGLLTQWDLSPADVAREYFKDIQTLSFPANHSTMGGSNGKSKKQATENLYVCTF